MNRSLSPDAQDTNPLVRTCLANALLGPVRRRGIGADLSPTAVTVPVGGSKTVQVSAASGEIQAESKNTAVVTVVALES